MVSELCSSKRAVPSTSSLSLYCPLVSQRCGSHQLPSQAPHIIHKQFGIASLWLFMYAWGCWNHAVVSRRNSHATFWSTTSRRQQLHPVQQWLGRNGWCTTKAGFKMLQMHWQGNLLQAFNHTRLRHVGVGNDGRVSMVVVSIAMTTSTGIFAEWD